MPKPTNRGKIHPETSFHSKPSRTPLTTDDDNIIIRCPCGYKEDDDFTIQCQKCLTWQHGNCMNVTSQHLPRQYICGSCIYQEGDPMATETTTAISTIPLRQQQQQQEKEEHSTIDIQQREQQQLAVKQNKIHHLGKKLFGKKYTKGDLRDISKNVFTTDTTTIKQELPLSNKRQSLKRRSILYDDDLKNNNEDSEDDDEIVTPYDYSTTSTRTRTKFEQISRNIIKSKLVKQTMKRAYDQWQINGIHTDMVTNMDSSTLAPSIPKVSVHPIWKSLLGRTNNKNDPSVRNGVFAEIHVPEQRFLMEINGEISIKSDYKNDTTSLYQLLHTPEDKMFFYPSLDLMIDARCCGNDSRFVRRSCYPNARTKCINLPNNKDDQTVHLGLFTMEDIDKGEEISIGWEWLQGSVIWDIFNFWKKQQQHQKQQQQQFFIMDNTKNQQLKKMLAVFQEEFSECACQDKDQCFVEYLKQICSKTTKKEKQRQQRRQRTNSSSEIKSDDITTIQQQRRSKDNISTISPSSSSQYDEHQQQRISKTIGANKRRRSKKSHADIATTSVAAKNDLFFASLPSSQSTNPVQHHKYSIPPLAHVTTKVEEKKTIESPIQLNKQEQSLPTGRLPCKKAWMKAYLAETANSRPSTLPFESTLDRKKSMTDDFWNDEHTTLIKSPGPTKSSSISGMEKDEDHTAITKDLVINDSSTTLNTVDYSDDPITAMTATTTIISTSKSTTSTMFTNSAESSLLNKDHGLDLTTPAAKPVKAKLSLQQYLSMHKLSNSNDSKLPSR
ncbi:uncharacterized protein BX664DRAFT_354965 [Halteromyces radiatus]|uniref:uncharacterized protein n=1 Tax=Halteromyces radiatus TaxID=101107 RepID=UPI0022210EA8|nr:uncharacterized protein BX664DRAFT_354965 [Halteromyces radiatus]KAI8099562.1 hypothetical protein BX664DRAFT_354965 [Halteromyces radiatus]